MPSEQPSVLFVCSQKGARSRIAELFFNAEACGRAAAQSACFEAGGFGPLMDQIMDEVGLPMPRVDVSSVYRHFTLDVHYDYVVFMCNNAMVEMCELFRNDIDRLLASGEMILGWQVKPFSALTGEGAERLAGARAIRDDIQKNVQQLATAIEAGNVAEIFTPINRCDLPGPVVGKDQPENQLADS